MSLFASLPLIISLLPHLILAFPSGAPSATCYSLEPSHGSSQPQSSPFPYTITVDKLVLVDDNPVRVTIAPNRPIVSSGGQAPAPLFKGFLVIAQPVNQTIDAGDIRSGGRDQRPPVSEWPQRALERAVGSLRVAAPGGVGAKALRCGDAPDSGLTHSENGEKTELVLEWSPVGAENGDYVLLTTIVKDFATYWAREPSPVVTVKRSTGGLGPVPVKPLPDDAHVATPVPQRIYTGCGTSKGCFGLPVGCVHSKSCEMVVTWYPSPENPKFLKFGLGGRLPSAGSIMGHVSVGFSSDQWMGSDLVVGCVLQNGKVHAKAYYNLPGAKQNAILKQEQQDLVEGENYGDYQDGLVFCEFEKPVLQAVKETVGQDFNFGKEAYYLLLARSLTVKEAKLGYHVDSVKDKGKSKEAVVLAKYNGVVEPADTGAGGASTSGGTSILGLVSWSPQLAAEAGTLALILILLISFMSFY